MSVFDLFRIATKAFLRHRMRALLTALGIIIGVSAFVTMVALGKGASARVNAAVESMGSNVLIVYGGSGSHSGMRGGMGSDQGLTDRDVDAIRNECDAVAHVAPEVRVDAQVVWGGMNWATEVQGTTPEYLEVRGWKIERGTAFDKRDVDMASKVCVLGRRVADELFAGVDPIGQTLRIRSSSCQIVGVLKALGSGVTGKDYDDTVLMPISTVRRKIMSSGGAPTSVSRIYLSAAGDVDRAKSQVQGLLRQRKNTSDGDPRDPYFRDLAESAEAAQDITRTLTLLLAGIAAVSLVVGGIGIMNIMLVSVTERTREIGIRLAIGAKGRHILLQFLLEAIVLSMAGGLVGLALGTATAKGLSAGMSWPTQVSPDTYALGFSFAVVIGVTFGFYPAWRASRLDPIDALRFD